MFRFHTGLSNDKTDKPVTTDEDVKKTSQEHRQQQINCKKNIEIFCKERKVSYKDAELE